MQSSEQTMNGQSTPHDEQAEKQVLSALLQRPDRLHDLAVVLKAEDFFVPRNELIYRTLMDLADKNLALDLVTLQTTLRAMGKLEDVGGVAYLTGLLPVAFSWENVTRHGELVAHLATLRRLIEVQGAGIEAARRTPPDGESVRAVCDECESNVFGVSEDRDPSGAKFLTDFMKPVFQRIEQQSGRGDLTGLPSGFYDLDDMLGGFNAGELTVIAARPSMGKTAFALNLMEYATLNPPEHLGRQPVVLFFSLEMGSLSIVQRMLCSRARVDSHRLRSGRLDTSSYQDLTQAAGELEASKLMIDDTPGLSIMALRSRARRVRHKQGLDMIVVDYLQLMGAKAENRQQEISLISRSLKELARELEVPVLALSQLSRGVESREEKRPLLSDLRESGSIEQDADVVMMLYRAEYYHDTPENKGKAEVIVAKQRNGPTGSVQLQFKGTILRFENLAPSTVEALQI